MACALRRHRHAALQRRKRHRRRQHAQRRAFHQPGADPVQRRQRRGRSRLAAALLRRLARREPGDGGPDRRPAQPAHTERHEALAHQHALRRAGAAATLRPCLSVPRPIGRSHRRRPRRERCAGSPRAGAGRHLPLPPVHSAQIAGGRHQPRAAAAARQAGGLAHHHQAGRRPPLHRLPRGDLRRRPCHHLPGCEPQRPHHRRTGSKARHRRPRSGCRSLPGDGRGRHPRPRHRHRRRAARRPRRHQVAHPPGPSPSA